MDSHQNGSSYGKWLSIQASRNQGPDPCRWAIQAIQCPDPWSLHTCQEHGTHVGHEARGGEHWLTQTFYERNIIPLLKSWEVSFRQVKCHSKFTQLILTQAWLTGTHLLTLSKLHVIKPNFALRISLAISHLCACFSNSSVIQNIPEVGHSSKLKFYLSKEHLMEKPDRPHPLATEQEAALTPPSLRVLSETCISLDQGS